METRIMYKKTQKWKWFYYLDYELNKLSNLVAF